MEREYRILEVMGKSSAAMREMRDGCTTGQQTMSTEDMLYLRQTLPCLGGTIVKSHIGLGAKGQEWTSPWQERIRKH